MISLEGVTKTYGRHTAVDGVTFTCRPGAVTGFLGPNGAGKSTTLRIVAGLTPATTGRALVGGVPYRDIPNPGTQVGVLLDASAQHAGRTGREVLALSALTMGLPSSRVAEVLDVVGLTPAEAGRRVRTYSLGMRQRLGLAGALLGRPGVLVLDEPANGLDPAGIHWMRGLLRAYADDGGTVLLSSHLLREMEVIADDVVVIGGGRVVAQGAMSDLLRAAGAVVVADDRAALARALAAAGIAHRPAGSGLRTEAPPGDVGRAAALAGVALTELRPAEGSGLEEIFLQLTGDTQRETRTDEEVAA